MKVALFHDYLNQWGGAERLLSVLCEMFPQAPIYTLVYDQNKLGSHFAGRQIISSFLDNGLSRAFHRAFIPLMPLASGLMRVENNLDLIISSSAGFAKGFRAPAGAKHLAYCHTPLRYAWEPEYLSTRSPNFRLLSVLSRPLLGYLRRWDFAAAGKPDKLIANSGFIAGKIKKYYGKCAPVIYPPVDTSFFNYRPEIPKKEYFLMAGRLMHYKKFDLAVEVFNALGWPLKIAGAGPEEAKLKRAASPNIKFCGEVDDSALRALYRGAQALIFPQVEDFGLVAAEAIACGTPVVAYAEGGALEIVRDGTNGILFYEQTVDDLASAIQEARETQWNHAAIAASAERFSLQNFKKRILEAVAALA